MSRAPGEIQCEIYFAIDNDIKAILATILTVSGANVQHGLATSLALSLAYASMALPIA